MSSPPEVTRSGLHLGAICVTLARLKLLFLLVVAVCDASMVVQVPYGKKQCFGVRVPNDEASVISGNFDLLDDEAEGSTLTAWITKVAGEHDVGSTLWHSDEDDHEEDFSVKVDAVGKYELCFELETDPSNDEYAESYDVGFDLRLDPAVPRTMEEDVQGPDTKQALQVIESAQSVEGNWQNLLDHYVYLRNREALAVQISQQIQARVMGWTFLEAFLVAGMAVAQVLYWKKFFETRRYL